MDFSKNLKTAQRLLAQEFYTSATREAARTLEHLLQDLYRQLLGSSSPDDQERLIAAQKKIGGKRPVQRFTFGQLLTLYRDGQVCKGLKQTLELKLTLLDADALRPALKIRNRASHEDYESDLTEARYLVNLVEAILVETGRLPAPDAVELSTGPELPDEKELVDWATYRRKLHAQLERERSRFGFDTAGLDTEIIPRLVTGITPTAGPHEERPWLEAAISGSGRLAVLLSVPGGGKTVCLHQLAIRLLEEYSRPATSRPGQKSKIARPLPVPIQLIRYDPKSRTLVDLITETLHECGLSVSSDSVLQVLNQDQQLLVLADGLDEAADKLSLVQELNSLIKTAAPCCLMVTCREAEFRLLREQLGFDCIWQLVQLGKEEIRSYLREQLPDKEDAVELERWLEDERILGVLQTPFFLSVFTFLQLQGTGRKGNRFQLSQAFVDELLRRELKHLGIQEEQARHAWQRTLDMVAYQMHQDQVARFSRSHFERIATDAWNTLFLAGETSLPWDQVQEVLNRLSLLRSDAGSISFAHALFQDFFAARWLEFRLDLMEIQGFVHFGNSPQWEYAIVLLAGAMPNSSQVIENLIYANSDHDLVVRCLVEASKVNPTAFAAALNWVLQSESHETRLKLLPFADDPRLQQEEQDRLLEMLVRTHILQVARGADSLHDVNGALADLHQPTDRKWVWQVAKDSISSTSAADRVAGLRLAAMLGEWDTVVGFVDDDHPWIRINLEWTIGKIATENKSEYVPELVKTLDILAQDSDEDVRILALDTLGSLRHPSARDALVRWMHHDNHRVALGAAMVLGKNWADDDAVNRILLGIHNREELEGFDIPHTLDRLLDALESIDTPLASEAIVAAVAKEDANPGWGAWVLTQRKDPRAFIIMLADDRELEDSNWYIDLDRDGRWLIPSRARRAVREAACKDQDDLYWLARSLILASFFLYAPSLTDDLLRDLIRTSPHFLADLARGGANPKPAFYDAFLFRCWGIVDELFSDAFAYAESLSGKPLESIQEELKRLLKDTIPEHVHKELENFDTLEWLETEWGH